MPTVPNGGPSVPDRHPSRRRPTIIGLVLLLSLLASACGAATTSTAAPTPINVNEMSMNPAEETRTPEPVESLEELPSAAPPSGDPEVEEVTVDYTLGADDAEAFAAAYRSTFEGADLDDQTVDTAGARLCTYLMRHADDDGAVAMEDAMLEADLNEPGYAREAWIAAFDVATAHYCGEFEVIE